MTFDFLLMHVHVCPPLPDVSFEGFELLVSFFRSHLNWQEGCGLLSSAAHPPLRDKTAAV